MRKRSRFWDGRSRGTQTRMARWFSRRPARVALLASAVALTCTSLCAAEDLDPWFGRDKALHFSACALIAGGGYVAGTQLFEARYEALLLGAGASATAGVTKELVDAAGAGSPSWRDLAWDAAGMAVGLGAAWGLDLLLRGSGDDRPLLASPAANSAGLVVSF